MGSKAGSRRPRCRRLILVGCGGALCIIACIKGPVPIKAMFVYLAGKVRPVMTAHVPPWTALLIV